MRFAIAIAAAAMLAVPAAAQYGRLVPTDRIIGLARRACLVEGEYQTAVPALATRERWDEYDKKPGTPATTRAWLVSLAGQPAIVDLERPGPLSTCSVSAVSDPASVARAVAVLLGRKADSTTRPRGGTVVAWRAAPGRPSIAVSSAPGQAMTRVTFSRAARP